MFLKRGQGPNLGLIRFGLVIRLLNASAEMDNLRMEILAFKHIFYIDILAGTGCAFGVHEYIELNIYT